MNIYTQRFSAICPRNKQPVDYVLRIETDEVIMVEDLQEFAKALGEGFHERFADDLHLRFGENGEPGHPLRLRVGARAIEWDPVGRAARENGHGA